MSLGRLFLALGVALGVLFTDDGSRRGLLVEGGEPETKLYGGWLPKVIVDQGKSKLISSITTVIDLTRRNQKFLDCRMKTWGGGGGPTQKKSKKSLSRFREF